MNKRDRSAMERKIREALTPPSPPYDTDEHLSAVRERAHELYQIHVEIDRARHERRRRRLRRAGLTFVFVVAVMVTGLMYAVYMPSLVSRAGGTIDTVVRQVRNLLQVNIDVNVPADIGGFVSEGEQTAFSSVEAYCQRYSYQIAYFAGDEWPTPSILVNALNGNIEQVTVRYNLNGKPLSVSTSVMTGSSVAGLSTENMHSYPWRDTTAYVWESEDHVGVLIFYQHMQIRIVAENITVDWLIGQMKSLQVSAGEEMISGKR